MKTKSIERILYENYKSNMKLHRIDNNILSYKVWLKDIFNKKVKL